MPLKVKIGWEEAILKVIEKNNGIATLNELYKEVPNLISGKSISLDFNHTIRAYLRRLKAQKNLVKQIGLSTYALSDAKYKNHLYEDIKDKKIDDSLFAYLPKDKIHGYVEGMLVEIGIFNNYETYTSDKNIIFNGKRLHELVHYTALPSFSYPEILDKVKQIDVIWFQDRFPIKTFDIEHSTDFTKAFLRAYQLKNFKTKFYMVANDDKIDIYEDRKNTPPFNTLKDDVNFVSFKKVFEEYKNAVIHDKIKSRSLFVN